VSELLVALQDQLKKRQILFEITAEVMRMPPEVKKLLLPSCVLKAVKDPTQTERLKEGEALRIRLKKAARGNVDEWGSLQSFVRPTGCSAQGKVGVKETEGAVQKLLTQPRSGAVGPPLLHPAKDFEPNISAQGKRLLRILVSRKYDAPKRKALPLSHQTHRLKIRSKFLSALTRLKTVVVREGM
jgi:hypothetical protein